MARISIYEWMEAFPWESDEQRKGFGALIKYLTELPVEVKGQEQSEIPCVAAWFIQKTHESNQWWTETMGNQISDLQTQIKALQDEIAELKRNRNV